MTQTVEIPADRRITLVVPGEIPTGKAKVEFNVIPFNKNDESSLAVLRGVSTPLADSLLGVASNLGNITLDEIRDERLLKHLV